MLERNGEVEKGMGCASGLGLIRSNYLDIYLILGLVLGTVGTLLCFSSPSPRLFVISLLVLLLIVLLYLS